MQVFGDNSGVYLNVWVSDANGQLWQFTFGRVLHQGWRPMTAALSTSDGWPSQALGEAGTNQPVPPLQVRALVVDGPESSAYQGVIYLDDLFAVRSGAPQPAPPEPVTPTPVTPEAVTPEPGPSLSCTVNPPRILPGERAILGWSSNAETVFLGDVQIDQSGTVYVTPLQTETYLFRAFAGSGETKCAVTLEVGKPEPPPVEQPPASIRFWVDDETIQLGQCTVLRWAVENVKAVYLEENGVAGQGEQQVCPKESQKYTLRVVTGEGEELRSVAVEVLSEIPDIRRVPIEQQPATIEFWASDEAVRPGACTSVNWSVANAREVYFEGEGVKGQGSSEVCPKQLQTYRLRVVSDSGEEIRTVTVDVLSLFTSPLKAAP